MPIIETRDYWTNEIDGYLWLVRDNVVDDPTTMTEEHARKLRIGPELNNTTPRIPPLDDCNNGNLFRLELFEMDVTDMPRIPDSVDTLVFTDTTITNLSQINVNWENIVRLELNNNRQLNTDLLIIPNGLEEILIINQQFMTIRSPPTLLDFSARSSYIHHLVGHLPKFSIQMDLSSNSPLYWGGLNRISKQCEEETENRWGMIEPILHKWHIIKLEFIRAVNHIYYNKMYIELGSIKHRIRNPVEHRENPIVAAMFLGSNYLRRAAEFMTEETIA